MAPAASAPVTPQPAPQSHSPGGLTTPLLAAAAGIAVISSIISVRIWLGSHAIPPEELLRMASRQYAAGNVVTAGELATRAELPLDSVPELAGERNFFIGAGYAHLGTNGADLAARRPAVHRAVEHLLLASANWPPGREDEGDRLLGEMLYLAGDFARAVPYLQKLADRSPAHRQTLVPTLGRCLLRGTDANVAQALQLLDETLALRDRQPAIEQDLLQLRAECLIRLNRFEEARQQLRAMLARGTPRGEDEVPAVELSRESTELLLAAADVSEAVSRFGSGDVAASQARPEVEQFLAPALKTLYRLQRDAAPDVAVQTGRWIARALLCVGNPGDALAQLSAVRLRQPFEGEAIAAGLEEIEHLVALRNSREAMQTARFVVGEIGSEVNFDPSVIDLASFRQRLQNVLTQLREQGETEACIGVARSLVPIFSLDYARWEEGLALRQAADNLAPPMTIVEDSGAAQRSAAARALYAQAGNAFEEAARLRFERDDYCETLWAAIDALQRSGQFGRSTELLSDYLLYEQRIRQPRGLVAQGRAYLASGNPGAAISPLSECMEEYPRDPLCYDARLLAARALAETDQLEQAKALLETNLTDGSLTPQSLTWKQSLLTLGELLWRDCHESHVTTELKSRIERQNHSLDALRANQPRIEEAIGRLREAVVRYWPDPQAMQSAALLARAYRLATELPRAEAQTPDVLEATRRRLVRQREQLLQNAAETHRKIRRELSQYEDERPLQRAEQLLLQTALLGEADMLFELGLYEQSADAYRTISLRYMNEPPALEAMVGQARCLRVLNRQREARLVIRQAALVLTRIPAEWDSRFEQVTRYDRRGWGELLAWMDSGPMPQNSDS